jgi:hypothetical protein
MPPIPAGSGDSKKRLNRTILGLEKVSNIQGKKGRAYLALPFLLSNRCTLTHPFTRCFPAFQNCLDRLHLVFYGFDTLFFSLNSKI